MKVALRESYPPITTQELDRLEVELGMPLPGEYREFLLAQNGGRPNPNVFQSQSGLEMVDWFLGLHDGEHDSLRKYINSYKGRVPSGLLPIAHDAGGNLLCISLTPEYKGEIYFWDHEKESIEDNAPTYDNVTFVAASLNEFLSMLKDLDDLTNDSLA